MRGAALLLAGLLALSACRREAAGPFEVSGRLVVFNYRTARATLLVTLRKAGPVEPGALVTASFDDPAGGAPIAVERKLFPGQDSVALETPPVRCIVKDRQYRVAIRVRTADGTALQSLETSVRSDQDQSVLPAEPLVTGPFYDANPKEFNPDGTTRSAANCDVR